MSAIVDATTGSKIVVSGWAIVPNWSAQPTIISVSGTTARSAALSVGVYRFIANTSCYYRQGDVTVDATTSDHFVPAGQEREFFVENATNDGYISAIRVSVSGSVYLHRLTERI